MKLIRLSPTHFKSFKAFTLQADGKDCVVEGCNGLGKTSLMDAYLFALVGKDSLGQSPGTGGFEIKTLDKKGNVAQHGLDHEVELVVEIANKKPADFVGKEPESSKQSSNLGSSAENPHVIYTLKKVYKEQWTTKRGGSDKEFTGHVVEHYIDGAPKSKGEYDSFVASICDPKRLLILSKPSHFNELPDDSKLGAGWIQRRRILVDTFGDVSDLDVMGSKAKFKPLAEALKNRSVDDFKKVLAVDKKKSVDARKEIPGRIDELTRQLTSDPARMSGAELTPGVLSDPQQQDELRARLKDLNQRKAEVLAGGQAAELTKRLRQLEAEGQEIYNRLRREAQEQADEAQRVLRQANFVLDGETAKKSRIEFELHEDRKALVNMGSRLIEKRSEFVAISQEGPSRVNDNCPSCGQPLPVDQIEAAIEAFNLAKSNRLEVNRMEGRNLKATEDRLREKIAAKESELATLDQSIADLTKQRDEAQTTVHALATAESMFHARIEFKENDEAKAKIKDQIASLTDEADTSAIDEEITECEQEIRAQDEASARVKAQAEARERIKELEAQEKKLGAEIEAIDKMLFLIEEFTKAKVAMLDDKINAKFSLVKWKLSEVQINEGVKECCICTVGGVPEPSLNHAMRIQAGIDIINVLSDAWGITVPCWIDGAESVNDIPPTRGQQIALVVSREKTLKVTAK